jgi:hypothetical protein
MKTLELEKKTGVWIDKQKAIIISFFGNDFNVKKIESGIETRERVDGESGHISRFGSQSLNPESKKENRLNEQSKIFLKKVVEELSHSDEFVIFGPSTMKMELAKELKDKSGLGARLKGIESADDMTENQMNAWVRSFFKL